jgi:hypothetical protein
MMLAADRRAVVTVRVWMEPGTMTVGKPIGSAGIPLAPADESHTDRLHLRGRCLATALQTTQVEAAGNVTSPPQPGRPGQKAVAPSLAIECAACVSARAAGSDRWHGHCSLQLASGRARIREQ